MPAALTSSIFSAYDCHFRGECIITQSIRFCYKDKDIQGFIWKLLEQQRGFDIEMVESSHNSKCHVQLQKSWVCGGVLSYERTRLLGCKGVFYLGEGKNILIGYLTLSHNMRRKVSSFSSSSFISNIPFFVRISYSDCGLVRVSGSGGRGEGAWNWRSS